MTAIMGKSLTTVVMAPGLSLREADSTAAAIVISGQGMYPITGYRSGDAERERFRQRVLLQPVTGSWLCCVGFSRSVWTGTVCFYIVEPDRADRAAGGS